LGMSSRRTNNFPESGRGLGHVTTRIFGSTVGYPSDSLASCFYWKRTLFNTVQKCKVASLNLGHSVRCCWSTRQCLSRLQGYFKGLF